MGYFMRVPPGCILLHMIRSIHGFMTNSLYRCQIPLFIDCVSVGVLKKLKNCGKPQRREVEVDFPEDNSWDCFFDELEIAPPEPLLVISNYIGDSTTSHKSTVQSHL